MQICANELKTILKNVLSKREYAEKIAITAVANVLGIHTELCFSTDNNIKSEGFSLETCRSMIALMDVSFQLISIRGLHITLLFAQFPSNRTEHCTLCKYFILESQSKTVGLNST